MRTIAAITAVTALAQALPAQTAEPTGLLVVAHGADSAWNARVLQTTARVSWSRGPTATAFLMGPAANGSGWTDAVRQLVDRGATRLVVVPLMVSSAGAHYRQLEYYVGTRERLPPALEAHDHVGTPPRPVPMELTPALEDAPELGAVLTERLGASRQGGGSGAVMLVAHGPSDERDARIWTTNLARAVGPVAGAFNLRFGIGLLRDDAPPEVRAAAIADLREQIERMYRETADSVQVVPVLVSSGRIGAVTIPSDLAGLPIRYSATALAPSPHLARWIERVASGRDWNADLADRDRLGLRRSESHH